MGKCTVKMAKSTVKMANCSFKSLDSNSGFKVVYCSKRLKFKVAVKMK